MESHSAETQPLAKKLKRQRWTMDDELHLLQIWETHEAELRKCKRNSHIYAQMAKEMGKFTAQEVHTKITNMVQRYRCEKKDIGPSGGSPSKWSHFHYVHKIIGSHAANNNTSLETFTFCHSNENSSTASPSTSCSDSTLTLSLPSLSSPPLSPSPSLFPPLPISSPLSSSAPFSADEPSTSSSAKRKKINYNAEILENLKELKENGKNNSETLRQVATEAHNISETLRSFLQQHQSNENMFMEYFKKLVERD